MDPITIAAIGAGISLVAGLIGKAIAEGDYAKARKLKEEAIAEYGEDILPQLETRIAQEVGPTELAKIQEDPEARDTQASIMRQLAEMGSGKMQAGDEAALALADEGASDRAASDYASNAQALASRGMGMGSGLAAAMSAQSGQDAINATARNRMQATADMRNRAFQALAAGGQMAGNIRGADYAQASDKASSQDVINRFNANQRDQAMNANENNAMRRYESQMKLKNARNHARSGLIDDYYGSGQRTENTAGGIGDAVTSVTGMGAKNAQGDVDYERALALAKAKGGR